MSRISVQDKPIATESKSKKKISFGAISSNVFLLFIATVVLIPALWMTIAPSKDRAELVKMSPLGFGSFESYITRWQNLLRPDDPGRRREGTRTTQPTSGNGNGPDTSQRDDADDKQSSIQRRKTPKSKKIIGIKRSSVRI